MIKTLKIKKNSNNNFIKIDNIKAVNIIFGCNGSGKSKFLRELDSRKIEVDTTKEILFMKYIDGINNLRRYQKEPIDKLSDIRELMKYYNSQYFSNGQTTVHYLLSFLKDVSDVSENNTNKSVIVLIDDINDISVENGILIIDFINELIMKRGNIQFFIAINHYDFIYAYKEVIDITTKKWITINSYEEYKDTLTNEFENLIKLNSNAEYLNIV